MDIQEKAKYLVDIEFDHRRLKGLYLDRKTIINGAISRCDTVLEYINGWDRLRDTTLFYCKVKSLLIKSLSDITLMDSLISHKTIYQLSNKWIS